MNVGLTFFCLEGMCGRVKAYVELVVRGVMFFLGVREFVSRGSYFRV